MNYIGFVQLRRGILEHTQSGRLSTHEYAVHSVLIMLADKETGRGEINAPLLRYYLPDLSVDAAQRALKSLTKKGYVYREKPARKKRASRFWINKYECTAGPHKFKRVCLDEVFRSKDVKDIRYVDTPEGGATEGAAQGATEGATDPAAQGANSNNNRKVKQDKREVAAVAVDPIQDSLNSPNTINPADPGFRRAETGIESGANTSVSLHALQKVSADTGATAKASPSKLDALAAVVTSRVQIKQSLNFTERESPGMELLQKTSLQDITAALDWAVQEPFWSGRVMGAGALKSLVRNLPTIQRQMAAQKLNAARASRPQLKARSVAPNPGKAFSYEGEII